MLDVLGIQKCDRDICVELQRELQAAGVDPLMYETTGGMSAGGLSLRVNTEQDCITHITRLLSKLHGHMQRGIPINLAITNIGGGDKSEYDLCRICEKIRESVNPQLLGSGLVGTSIHSHQLPLQAFKLICDALLGTGPRYVVLDSLQMQHHANEQIQELTDANWRFLWNQRMNAAPLSPAYSASIRPASPLLASEAAGSILPAFGVPVPANTAWCPIEIRLPRFADSNGRLDWADLKCAIELCVFVGDRLLDLFSWSTPAQARDAWQNRRLAILVTGIGDLVSQGGGDPSDLGCLEDVCTSLARINGLLKSGSGLLAQEQGSMPALMQADPSSRWSDSAHRRNWSRRWQAALQSAAVRNRNMLALSPYSFLPKASSCNFAYADLLPGLRFADAIAFADPPDFAGWTFSEYRQFHRRAWATIQRHDAPSVIAAGV